MKKNEKKLIELIESLNSCKTADNILLSLSINSYYFRNNEKIDFLFYSFFKKAFTLDPEKALAWLFFLRDIKVGKGERRLFRLCFYNFSLENPKLASLFIPLIPFYGR